MTTQHTSDHEQPDHEPRVEAGVSANSQSEADKMPPSKKNWDRKTRRRHSVSTEDPSPAPDQTESDQESSEQAALDQQPKEEQLNEEKTDESSSTSTSAIKDYSQPAEQPLAETSAVEEVPAEESSVDLAGESSAEASAEEPLTEELPAEELPAEEPAPLSEQPDEMSPAKTTAVKDYSKPIDHPVPDSSLSEAPQQQDEESQQKEDSDLWEDQVQETLVEVVEADEASDHDVVESIIEEHIVEEPEDSAEPEKPVKSEESQEVDQVLEPKEEAEPQDTEESAEPEPESEQSQEPEQSAEPEKSEEPQEPEPAAEQKETRAPSVALFEDDFDDELYASLEVSAPESKDAFEGIEESIDAVEAAAEEAEESIDAVEAATEEIEEPIRQEPKPESVKQPAQTKKPTKRKKADVKPADQQAPQQQPSRQQQQQEETEPQRREQQPKQRQRDQRQTQKQDERQQAQQQKQDDQQRTKPQRAKRQRAQEQREQDQQRVQQKTERQQQEREQQRERQQQREKQQQQREQQKQRQRQQCYLKSSSFKQAFRNLLKLNAGTAWREMRVPIVTFFVLFSLLALAVADALPAIDAFNAAIISAVHSLRGVLDTFVVALTTIGDFLPMAGLCLVVCLILYLAKKWDSLAFFIVNVVLAIVCVQVLKLIFAVPRPTAETLVPLPQSFSFPSAHSFCSLIVFGMIGLLIYRALIRRGVSDRAARIPGVILIIFAILVGISRIYVGVHWPSDVLGGWLLAGTWLSYVGALYTAGARQTGRHQR